ncbi:hypothetical protein C8R42DRAFT_532860, partial [Lentinula raphanica]
AWSKALALHSCYNQSFRPPENVDSTYFLPPPRVIDGPSNKESRAFYYHAWLTARPLILKSFDGFLKPVNLSAKWWRCLLDVVGGRPLTEHSKNKNSLYRVEMRTLLENLMRSHSQSYPDHFLLPQNEEFHGYTVDCSKGPPPKNVSSQILWEISELSFRHELVTLDRHLDTSGLLLTKRDALLDACWVG